MKLTMIIVASSGGRSDGAGRSILMCLKVDAFVTVILPLLLSSSLGKKIAGLNDLEDCRMGQRGVLGKFAYSTKFDAHVQATGTGMPVPI